MVQILKKFLKGITIGYFLCIFFIVFANTLGNDAYQALIWENTGYIKKYAPYTPPLKDSLGRNYCSSSIVRHGSHVFTVTNNHCCDTGVLEFGPAHVRVGDTIETIVHRSYFHDICILTSWLTYSPIRISSKPAKMLDKVLVMGYPRGAFLTPRFGHVIGKDYRTCIPRYDGSVACTPGLVVSATTYGGCSGSPVIDSNGRITAVIHAGNIMIHTFGIAVPHRFLKEALDAAAKASE